jgi:hypothetical protein
MGNEVKENDLVKRVSPSGTVLTARVRWVNEKGEAGVTYITPEAWQGGAQVVNINELEVIQGNIKEDLSDVPTKDLITAITRLRDMRMPAKLTTRKTSVGKKVRKSKLDKLLEEGGNELDALLAKAAKELKEEGGDK